MPKNIIDISKWQMESLLAAIVSKNKDIPVHFPTPIKCRVVEKPQITDLLEEEVFFCYKKTISGQYLIYNWVLCLVMSREIYLFDPLGNIESSFNLPLFMKSMEKQPPSIDAGRQIKINIFSAYFLSNFCHLEESQHTGKICIFLLCSILTNKSLLQAAEQCYELSANTGLSLNLPVIKRYFNFDLSIDRLLDDLQFLYIPVSGAIAVSRETRKSKLDKLSKLFDKIDESIRLQEELLPNEASSFEALPANADCENTIVHDQDIPQLKKNMQKLQEDMEKLRENILELYGKIRVTEKYTISAHYRTDELFRRLPSPAVPPTILPTIPPIVPLTIPPATPSIAPSVTPFATTSSLFFKLFNTSSNTVSTSKLPDNVPQKKSTEGLLVQTPNGSQSEKPEKPTKHRRCYADMGVVSSGSEDSDFTVKTRKTKKTKKPTKHRRCYADMGVVSSGSEDSDFTVNGCTP